MASDPLAAQLRAAAAAAAAHLVAELAPLAAGTMDPGAFMLAPVALLATGHRAEVCLQSLRVASCLGLTRPLRPC